VCASSTGRHLKNKEKTTTSTNTKKTKIIKYRKIINKNTFKNKITKTTIFLANTTKTCKQNKQKARQSKTKHKNRRMSTITTRITKLNQIAIILKIIITCTVSK
jgi:hypothetical protein